MITLVLSCFFIALLIRLMLRQMQGPSRQPTVQAILCYLAMDEEYDVEGTERPRGIADALKRARSEKERRKGEDLLRTVIAEGPPGQALAALGAAWALQFADFDELRDGALRREVIDQADWDAYLELLQEELDGTADPEDPTHRTAA